MTTAPQLSFFLFWDISDNPLSWLYPAFVVWMLVDAVRRREWVWVLFIAAFSKLSPLLYFFFVYRESGGSSSGFELPGTHDRKRIKDLEAQIHHLDKAHHHLQLGDIYFQQSKFDKAEACYRAALERDPAEIDARAHLGQCLLRRQRPAEARPLLEHVCAENPRHDYGYTRMALAETLAALGETDAAMAAWRIVLAQNSYARARVQLAELLLAKGSTAEAQTLLREVVSDDAHAPAFQRARERIWVRRAKQLAK